MSIFSKRPNRLGSYLLTAIFCTSLGAGLIQCSKDDGDKKSPPKDSFSNNEIENLKSLALATNQILILDEKNRPLSAAQLLIGTDLNQPFQNNLVQADAQGLILLPVGWVNPQPITVIDNRCVRTTFMQQNPGAKILRVRLAAPARWVEVKGQTSGIQTAADGKVDFALILPTLSKGDLFNFNLSQFLNPLHDSIHLPVAGDVDLPANIALPLQSENYFLFNIQINKPLFRNHFRNLQSLKLEALHGQLKVSEAIGALRGLHDPVKLVNLMQFQSAGTQDVQVTSDMGPVTIAAGQKNLGAAFKVQTPDVPSQQTMIALSLDASTPQLSVNDFKATRAKTQLSLMASANSHKTLVAYISVPSIAFQVHTQDFHLQSYSGALSDPGTGSPVTLLPTLPLPTLQSWTQVQMRIPNLPPGLPPARMTQASLSQIQTVETSGSQLTIAQRVWDVFAPDWSSEVSLPTVPGDKQMAGKFRWNYAILAGAELSSLEPAESDSITHFSSSSLDFSK